MIIKLKLIPETLLSLPLNYNYYVQSMIYRLLQDIPEYSVFLHDKGYSTGALKFRMFTFSGLSGHYNIVDKQIVFDGIINLEIRSVSEEFIFILRNSLRKHSHLILKGQKLKIVDIAMFKRLILPHRIEIRTISPIVASKKLENGFTKYFTPEDIEFEGNICNNFKKKFNAYYNILPEDGISLIVRPQGIKHVITHYHDTVINAYHARLVIGGNPQYLQFLYDTGLGAKNAQGFGLFEICS